MRVLFRLVLLVILPAPMDDNGGENLNTFLAFLHEPAQLLLHRKTGYPGNGRALPCNCEDVSKRIGMETGHCGKVGGRRFALACLKLLEQETHGLLDELLREVIFLCVALLVGRFALVAERRILPVRRNACGCGAGCVRHNVLSSGARLGQNLKEGFCLKPNSFV